jgi:hypothetical protein
MSRGMGTGGIVVFVTVVLWWFLGQFVTVSLLDRVSHLEFLIVSTKLGRTITDTRIVIEKEGDSQRFTELVR